MSDAEMPLRATVTIRPLAIHDIEQQAQYLNENAAPEAAQQFRAAIQKAVAHLAVMPYSGAPREIENPRLHGLRRWILPYFRNYLLFYLTPQGNVEIVRVLHGAQDIDAILDAEEDGLN